MFSNPWPSSIHTPCDRDTAAFCSQSQESGAFYILNRNPDGPTNINEDILFYWHVHMLQFGLTRSYCTSQESSLFMMSWVGLPKKAIAWHVGACYLCNKSLRRAYHTSSESTIPPQFYLLFLFTSHALWESPTPTVLRIRLPGVGKLAKGSVFNQGHPDTVRVSCRSKPTSTSLPLYNVKAYP